MKRYLLVLLVVASSGGFGPPAAQANLPPGVDGCDYFSTGRPGYKQDGSDLPFCDGGGNGCYECCVTLRDQSAWLFCTEVAGNVFCSGPTTAFPDWWPDPNPADTGQPGDQLPPDTLPPSNWTGDDNGGTDLGGGGGGDNGCSFDCRYAYGTHHYGRLVPKHAPYRP